MIQTPKHLQSPTKFIHPPRQIRNNFPVPKQFKLSRRELTISGNSSLLLFLGSSLSKARAEENPNPNPNPNPTNNDQEEEKTSGPDSTTKVLTKRAFLDISIDGEPIGRITIGLHGDDAPIGTTRFSSLVSGSAGVSYRRKEFVKIMPNYVQHGGLRSFGLDAEIAKKTGGDLVAESLKEELERVNEKSPGTKNVAGTISIIVSNPSKPPPKMKLVARKGKLEIDQEEVGKEPNGTEFTISIKDSPELDSSALVVGQVLEGMEVVERIGKVQTVQDNTSSPYFKVAKLVGDKRATVAEKGFNRPYSKVVVTNCGLID